MVKGRSHTIVIQTIILIGIVFILNVIARNVYTYIDLTQDQRFTLTSSTERVLTEIEEIITIDLLLEGDLPSEFISLQNRTIEIIKQFRNVNPNLEYIIRNPSVGTVEEVNTIRENLAKDRIFPTNIFIVENDQRVEKLIYPWAIIKYGNKKIPVSLLEPQGIGETEEATINKSENLIEHKLAKALHLLFKKDIPHIVFVEGHEELLESQTARLQTDLSSTMTTSRINLDTTYRIDADVLIVAGPKTIVNRQHQFLIDQYIMNGGKVIWFIDQLYVNLDSIRGAYVPRLVEHGLEDMFFKYGVRINNNVVLDLENSKIPQVIGRQGGKPQQQLFSWVYFPLLQSTEQHPIVKNIDRVYSTFPSSIDVLDNKQDIESKVLLTSSRSSRYQVYPMRISFDILKVEQRPEAYNKPNLTTAVMLEGEFESFFKNRVPSAFKETLDKIDTPYKEKSVRTSQIFVSDSDIIKNLFDAKSSRISPMGYNKWEGQVYNGNSDFILNSIDYLTDDYGLIESRSKELHMRLLNKVAVDKDRLKWQIINVVLPVLLIIFCGFLINFARKRRYA